MEVWKIIFLFSWVFFRLHVKFQGCTNCAYTWKAKENLIFKAIVAGLWVSRCLKIGHVAFQVQIYIYILLGMIRPQSFYSKADPLATPTPFATLHLAAGRRIAPSIKSFAWFSRCKKGLEYVGGSSHVDPVVRVTGGP